MIQKLAISGIHTDVSEDLEKYITKKVGKLDQYMSRHARESAHAEVKLKEAKIKNKKECTCEVILHLPHDVITTKETTRNMFAAVDVVEAKLKNQLKRYKEKHKPMAMHRRLLTRLRHREGSLES